MRKVLSIVVTMIVSLFLTGCLGESTDYIDFSLNGDSIIQNELGTTFSDPGFIAKFGKEDISENVAVSGSVDINTIGTYILQYKLSYNDQEYDLVRVVNIVKSTINVDVDEILYDGTCSDVEIHYIDLDAMGDSTLIQCGDYEILIDAGLKSSGSNIVVPYLEEEISDGVIEIVVVTHPDQDHIGGFVGLKDSIGVFDAFTIEKVIDYGYDKSTVAHAEYETDRDNEGSLVCDGDESLDKTGTCRPYFMITNDLKLEIIDTGFYENHDTSDNENSIVVMLTHKNKKFLFTGDAEEDAEENIASLLNHVDVYKAGHHGSNTASTDTLLSAITPDTIIMSADRDNKYNIPPQESLDRMYQYTDDIYVTFENGHIVILSDGDNYTVTGSIHSEQFHTTDWFEYNRIYPNNASGYFVPLNLTYDGPRLDDSFENIDPINPRGGYFDVTLKYCADGDTAVFYYPQNVYNAIIDSKKRTRFLNMDTEETYSGGEEEWGKPGSVYTCDLLTNAESIILQTDPGDNLLGNYDRLLAWVWIMPSGETEYQLLNYMVVKQGLAEVKYLFGAGETIFVDGKSYTEWMYKAENYAKENDLGKWSETLLDPFWDYVNEEPLWFW